MQRKALTKLYGYIPKRPEHLTVETVNAKALGKSEIKSITFTAYYGDRSVSFSAEAYGLIERTQGAAIIYLGKSDSFADYAEKKVEAGIGVLRIPDEEFFRGGKFTDISRELLYRKKQRGLLPLLAWAAVRAYEFLSSEGVSEVSVKADCEYTDCALIASYIEPRLVNGAKK